MLSLKDKTGFKVTSPDIPVIIRDYRGLPFYDTTNISPRVTVFNLPAGKYFVDSGEFEQLPEPVKFRKIKLPPFPERKLKDPFDFKILFGENPKKCSINFNKEWIFFDDSFRQKTLPELYFVLFHEFAHQYFDSEHWTDVLASNYMLEKGFNPEQIWRAHITSLSEHQHERKKFNGLKLKEIMNDFEVENSYDLEKPKKGLYISSPLGVNIYENPGGKLLRTTTPNGYIGKVYGTNTAGTWIDITPGGSVTGARNEWLINNSSLKYTENLTDFQKQDFANRYASKETAGKLNESLERKKELENSSIFDGLSDSIGEGFNFLTGSFKWLIIGAVVVILIVLFMKLKN